MYIHWRAKETYRKNSKFSSTQIRSDCGRATVRTLLILRSLPLRQHAKQRAKCDKYVVVIRAVSHSHIGSGWVDKCANINIIIYWREHLRQHPHQHFRALTYVQEHVFLIPFSSIPQNPLPAQAEQRHTRRYRSSISIFSFSKIHNGFRVAQTAITQNFGENAIVSLLCTAKSSVVERSDQLKMTNETMKMTNNHHQFVLEGGDGGEGEEEQKFRWWREKQ